MGTFLLYLNAKSQGADLCITATSQPYNMGDERRKDEVKMPKAVQTFPTMCSGEKKYTDELDTSGRGLLRQLKQFHHSPWSQLDEGQEAGRALQKALAGA